MRKSLDVTSTSFPFWEMPGKPWIYEFEHAKLCILSVPRLLHLEAMGNEMASVDPKEYTLNLWDKGWEFDDITNAQCLSG